MYDTICEPGARMSGFTKPSCVGPVADQFATVSSFQYAAVRREFTAPTVITYGSLPGTVTVRANGPVLPAAASTTMPACHARSTARFSGSTKYGTVANALMLRLSTR